jgi:hypothetical protein
MIRALLDGRKTQTRRVLNPQPTGHQDPAGCRWRLTSGYKATATNPPYMEAVRPTSYGAVEIVAGPRRVPCRPGDRLWVREAAWICPPRWTDTPANPMGPDRREVAYKADDRGGGTAEAAADYKIKLRPSIHMPRWASRLTLLVTDVRVQRLQDIREEDALAEGVVPLTDPFTRYLVPGVEHPNKDFPELSRATAREMYAALWDVINGSGAWLANPWVVAVSFDVRRCNIDSMGGEG